MKQLKTTLALFLALAAMAAGIWGDHRLDERYQNVNVGPESAIEMTIDDTAQAE